MEKIRIVTSPERSELETKGVFDWPIWEKEVSEFDWYYEDRETCYFLEGKVEVIIADGTSYHMGAGDLVTFPKGLSCFWKVFKPVKKHYHFG